MKLFTIMSNIILQWIGEGDTATCWEGSTLTHYLQPHLRCTISMSILYDEHPSGRQWSDLGHNPIQQLYHLRRIAQVRHSAHQWRSLQIGCSGSCRQWSGPRRASLDWTIVKGSLLGQQSCCLTSCSGLRMGCAIGGYTACAPRPDSRPTHHTSFAVASLGPLSGTVLPTNFCLHVVRCLHGSAPAYLTELLHAYTRDQRLRPAPHLQLTSCRPKRAVGRADFRVAGPAASNTLPSSLRAADSLYN